MTFTRNFPVFLVFFVYFSHSAKLIKEPPMDYNVEIDKVLSGIEDVVRIQNETDFSRFFSESFDSEGWYRKFFTKLTPEQAATYSLSRFGDVKDGKLVQFTESVRLNDTFTRRTPFDAVVAEMPTDNGKILVIDSLTVHDGKGGVEEDSE